ncbi:unnamed protein product [Lota lota]
MTEEEEEEVWVWRGTQGGDVLWPPGGGRAMCILEGPRQETRTHRDRHHQNTRPALVQPGNWMSNAVWVTKERGAGVCTSTTGDGAEEEEEEEEEEEMGVGEAEVSDVQTEEEVEEVEVERVRRGSVADVCPTPSTWNRQTDQLVSLGRVEEAHGGVDREGSGWSMLFVPSTRGSCAGLGYVMYQSVGAEVVVAV